MEESTLTSMNDLIGLAKRRGFIFQSSEIYGGLASCWDYGPLGVELKNNIKKNWWNSMTAQDEVVGLDASILMHPRVWEASGHVEGFHDPLVDCKNCKERFRIDQLKGKNCPKCGAKKSFTDVRNFNLMFKTQYGAMEDTASQVYLRPETAQGIFVNFSNVQSSMRKKIPFGICQIGKAFRNEITPGNFIFRTREFEQMEMQYFIKPGEQKKTMDKWQEIRWDWHMKNGIRSEKLHLRYHKKEELAHYADAAIDIEYDFPIGRGEIEGIHSRTDFDLKRHQEFSGKSVQYSNQVTGEKYLPFVVETSAGCDRSVLAIMCDAYRVEKNDKESRVVMKFSPALAPVKLAILPLMRKEELENIGRKLYDDLRFSWQSLYDSVGSIGKRYRRQDEIGTPFCLTVDYESLQDKKVTIRERDSMKQERISFTRLKEYIEKQLNL